ncbi:hypothetical protein diail_4696 [Diaporthe ilicicola]|nr:hypothetical protein diail_4696 [Diaporthe ilicicola]
MAFEKRNKKQLEHQRQRQRQRPHPSPDTPCASAGSIVSSTPGPPSPPLSSSSSPTSLPPSLLAGHQPHERATSRNRSPSPASLPKSVADAFHHLRQAHRGRHTGPSWISFIDVRPDELQALLCAAESAGIHKYRYDYEPSQRLLTLRMPEGAPHLFTKNGFARSILRRAEECLQLAIRDEEKGDRVQALRSLKIAPNVEAEVKFPTGGERRPDVAFFYKGERYPPLVVEIGHSQKAVSLAGLARSYIRDTGAMIHTVITAKFVYLTPHERADVRRQRRQPRRVTRSQSRQRGSTEESMSHATRHSYVARLSLYRLGKRLVHDQVFRDAQGKPTDGGLELSIADLVPWDDGGEVTAAGLGPLSRAELESLTFIVPFSELCEALTWGEEQQALEEQTPTPEFAARAGQKRVHFDDFDWSEPDEGQEEEDEGRDDGDDDEVDGPGRRSRSSKRRRLSADERPYRDRSSRSQSTSQIPTRSSSRIAQGQEL